jgi:hypothetical protein
VIDKMGWSQVVHENRKRAELSRALDEFKKRKRGYDMEVEPNARMPALLVLAGVLSGTAWWRREGRKVHGRDWRSLPIVQQVLEFLQQNKTPTRTSLRGKAKPKQVQPLRKTSTHAPAAPAARPTLATSNIAGSEAGNRQATSSNATGGSSSSSAGARPPQVRLRAVGALMVF